MSNYEITFPNAAPMIDMERAERLPPREAYATRGVVAHVCEVLWRDYWLNECGHRHACNLVESLIHTLGNAGPWQGAVLHELQQRFTEQGGRLYGPYVVGMPPHRAYYETPHKEVALRMYRRDHAPMIEWG